MLMRAYNDANLRVDQCPLVRIFMNELLVPH